MSKIFEVVIFTAGLKDYADWILNQIDRKRVLIHHRLYRNSCMPVNGIYIKDLDKLGRDIRKTIIVDNIAENFDCQPDNGIHIISWYNDPKDNELQKLEPILKNMVR